MARRTMISRAEPLYDIDPHTGLIIEVFHCEPVLAKSFDAPNPGWFWWTCRHECLPQIPPHGLFVTSYRAYCNAMTRGDNLIQIGKRKATAERPR